MAKRLAVRVEDYQKDGETKGRYVNLGVILSSDKGEYVLIDPTVSLAGCLTRQNMMNHARGKPVRSSLMVNIFDDNNQGQQQQGQQQQNQQQPQNNQQQGQQQGPNDFDDDIPF